MLIPFFSPILTGLFWQLPQQYLTNLLDTLVAQDCLECSDIMEDLPSSEKKNKKKKTGT